MTLVLLVIGLALSFAYNIFWHHEAVKQRRIAENYKVASENWRAEAMSKK